MKPDLTVHNCFSIRQTEIFVRKVLKEAFKQNPTDEQVAETAIKVLMVFKDVLKESKLPK